MIMESPINISPSAMTSLKSKESERMIRDLAYNDQLTSLPNRTSFRKMFYQEIEVAKKQGTNRAFVYMNIDRLRYVNDSLGHEVGDYILSVIAKRLRTILPEKTIIGRLSGDEFAFLLLDIRDAQHAEQLIKEVQQYIEEPIEVEGPNAHIIVKFRDCLVP